MQNAARLLAPVSGIVAITRPVGPRWAQRDLGIRLARARGLPESAINAACACYADTKYQTRKPSFWVDEIIVRSVEGSAMRRHGRRTDEHRPV